MLYSKREPAHNNAETAPELVLLHGWGCSSVIWNELLPLLRGLFNTTVIDLPGFGQSKATVVSDLPATLKAIAEVVPPQAIYMGYSLGGMLAVKMVEQFPERVVAIITIAANARFVVMEDWPQAMPENTYQQFYQRVAKNPLAGLKRFRVLEMLGAEFPIDKGKNLEEIDAAPESLLASLDLLYSIDNTETLQSISIPALHIFGERDQLVPAAVVDAFKHRNFSDAVLLSGAPHGMPVSHANELFVELGRFLQEKNLMVRNKNIFQHNAPPRDKCEVARSFSRAASSYDSVAALQRQVGETLLSLLSPAEAECVLDLGAGTGYFYSPLQALFPAATYIGLDLAEGMARYAQQQHSEASWLCGDAEVLPFADNTVDIIFSSLAVQWCDDCPSLFAEAMRVLKPGGQWVFSTLGPNTLNELRSAWQCVDSHVHVNRFSDQSVLECAASKAGFCFEASNALLEETITLEYQELRELTRELKSLGAHNMNSGRPMGLTGKQRIQAFKAAYEQWRNENGLLPASYQVWYVSLHKPVAQEPVEQEPLVQKQALQFAAR